MHAIWSPTERKFSRSVDCPGIVTKGKNHSDNRVDQKIKHFLWERFSDAWNFTDKTCCQFLEYSSMCQNLTNNTKMSHNRVKNVLFVSSRAIEKYSRNRLHVLFGSFHAAFSLWEIFKWMKTHKYNMLSISRLLGNCPKANE